MLREGRARRAEGEDVVIGFVETYSRPLTIDAIGNLETVPRLKVAYRGTTLEEMDLEAVLARRPQVALVDELAHTNAPGVRHPKRWQDVEELRDAGIDVLTTVNVQHVESVKDLVEGITGIPVRETVPDSVLDSADEIQFIDIAPEALRKRMRHGNIYAREKVDTALRNFFRPGNLGALREIALRLVAQSVGATTRAVRPEPQDVLVAVSGKASSEPLIRLGARLARRTGALCSVLVVVPPHQILAVGEELERARLVAEQVGASFIVREGSDLAKVIEEVAREHLVRHLVLGESRRSNPLGRWRATPADRLIEGLPDIDVHILAQVAAGHAAKAGPPQLQRPEPDALLRSLQPTLSRRGMLRIYLGYARGCGTTMAMLDEARRRKSRGTDVVVAAVSTHGRSACEQSLGNLELLGGPNGSGARGILDVDALLARNPQVACIDDLAGVDTRGGPRADALRRILEAGTTLIATLHLTDLRSTADAMVPVLRFDDGHPTIEDSILAMADEIELVDVTPSVLIERLRHGEIVPPAEVGRALQTEFRPQVLASLRELAFRTIAQHADRELVEYMHERKIESPWEARPRVLACVPPRKGMERLIRRAAALASVIDGEFKAATVRTRPRSEEEKKLLGGYAALTHQLGGEFITLRGSSVARTLADYARHGLVTEMVVTRGRPHRRWRRSALRDLVRMVTDVDIHIVSADGS
jgi:two-component system sensor histidine kinase KdpD